MVPQRESELPAYPAKPNGGLPLRHESVGEAAGSHVDMSTAAVPSYLVYCDGACEPNPGTGGWGAIVLTGEGKVLWKLKGGPVLYTTNNQMEILAVIEALKVLPIGSSVTVCTDSQLVVNTLTKGWRKHTNQLWWDRLDREVHLRKVQWQWVRGHNGDRWNEVADSLAVEGISQAGGQSV